MIVLSLTNCPHALRGDLTRWLFEVDTNLYVGNQTARVRDKIWERVVEHTKSGRAVMVYPTNNEQGFDFRVCGATWDPIDYDGLKLMLRPHPGSAHADVNKLKQGDSKVEKRLVAKRFAKTKRGAIVLPDTYLAVDIETTGLSSESDEIIEVGCLKVVDKKIVENYHAIVYTDTRIPPQIEALTGLTSEIIVREGRDLKEVVGEFREFAQELPLVSHNVAFDMSFLRKAYRTCGYPLPTNSCIDTLRLAQKLLTDTPDYKLETLVHYFQIELSGFHRAFNDCAATQLLFENLRILFTGNTEAKVNESGEDE